MSTDVQDYEIVHSAVVVLTDDDGRVLLLKRRPDDRSFVGWGFPGGKLDQDESIPDAAIRELYEETGLVIQDCIFPRSPMITVNDKRKRVYMISPAYARYDEGTVTLSDEHVDYAWLKSSEAIESLVLAGPATEKVLRDLDEAH